MRDYILTIFAGIAAAAIVAAGASLVCAPRTDWRVDALAAERTALRASRADDRRSLAALAESHDALYRFTTETLLRSLAQLNDSLNCERTEREQLAAECRRLRGEVDALRREQTARPVVPAGGSDLRPEDRIPPQQLPIPTRPE